jgi:hypothetical protein
VRAQMIQARRGGVNAGRASWHCGAPSPLLFAIPATLHAAPLPKLSFAGVYVVDITIGGVALSDFLAVRIYEQSLDSERTGVQGHLGCRWRRPTVTGEPRRWRRDQRPCCMRCLNRGRDRMQIELLHWSPQVRRRQDVVQVLAQPARAMHDARASTAADMQQAHGNGGLDKSRQLREPQQVTVSLQLLDRGIRGSLIQRIHEIERRMTSTPLERASTITHSQLLPHAMLFHIVTSKIEQ